MRSIRNLALAGALALVPVMGQAAFAQEGIAYPRATGSGENISVEYGPAPRGNVVGGGPVSVRYRDSEHVEVTYLDAQYAQRRTDGLSPVAVGTGENVSVSYVAPREAAAVPLATLLRRLGG